MLRPVTACTKGWIGCPLRSRNEVKQEEKEKPKQLTQNNVFVGSTTDLQRMLLDKAGDTIDVDPNE